MKQLDILSKKKKYKRTVLFLLSNEVRTSFIEDFSLEYNRRFQLIERSKSIQILAN